MTEATAQARTAAGGSDTAPFGRVCAVTELPSDTADIGRYRGFIEDTWTIGPKLHGGTMVAGSAAAATRWLRRTAPALEGMFPIAASTDFLGAPDPGEVEYAVHIRKTGRQISLVEADLVQHGRALVHTTFTFGHLDDTPPAYAADTFADMPVAPPADALGYGAEAPMGDIVHVAHGASMRMDGEWARFAAGEQGAPRLRLWIRPRPGDEQDDDVAIYFALMAGDISPPVTMNRGVFGWAPTVQLTTYLRRRPAPGWLRVVATSTQIGKRMFDEDQVVIDATGTVVVQSRQLALLPQSSW
ncbi:thioesterase family protein [Nocardia sp. alder85J]|uniref:thioesterase family protein n=1 Tax=Nocardia sp. alder85J TaxID=2862949 RepID=UPI001CD706B0|nr:thioesterase family protein [Nocardia sp. alder85J]MCX4098790.1 thioesterase family protein [Nocardia sp. alder85J]